MPIAAAKIVNIIVFTRTFTKKIDFLLIFFASYRKTPNTSAFMWQGTIKVLGAQFGNTKPTDRQHYC